MRKETARGGAKLIRKSRYEIQRPEDLARLGVAEGALEEGADLAAAVDVAECPVDGKAKLLVAAGQRERIGLNRQIVLGQHKLAGRFAVIDQGDQNRPVCEIGGDLALREQRDALGVGFGGDDVAGNTRRL